MKREKTQPTSANHDQAERNGPPATASELIEDHSTRTPQFRVNGPPVRRVGSTGSRTVNYDLIRRSTEGAMEREARHPFHGITLPTMRLDRPC